MLQGFGFLLLLALPGLTVFAWHLKLVSRRAERKQAGVEVIATGVYLSQRLPRTGSGCGRYDPAGLVFSCGHGCDTPASAVSAYLRLDQRELKRDKATGLKRSELWKMGKRALLYTTFNLIASLILGLAKLIPFFIFIPFLVQWLETLWGNHRILPSVGSPCASEYDNSQSAHCGLLTHPG